MRFQSVSGIFRRSLPPFFLIVLTAGFTGCAHKNGAPPEKRFSGHFQRIYGDGRPSSEFRHFQGVLVDTLVLYDRDGSIGYQAVYFDSNSAPGPGRIGGRYVLAPSPAPDRLGNDPKSIRFRASLNAASHAYKELYLSFLKNGAFAGRVELELWISPEGNLRHVLCVLDTTGKPEFIDALMDAVAEWEPPAWDPSGYTVIRFSMEFQYQLRLAGSGPALFSPP